MATPEFNEIDFLEVSKQNSTSVFKDKPVFEKYLELLSDEKYSLQQAFKDLFQLRGIDEARGFQLDVIGRIVGQPRTTIVASLVKYFGFAPNPLAEPFGDLGDPSVGGRFRSANEETENSRTLTDEEYRLFIKAKIIKNVGKGTIENIIESILFLLPNVSRVFLREDPGTLGNAAFSIAVDRPLTATEELIITGSNIIPKPVGVSITVDGEDVGFGNNWTEDWGS